MPAPTGAAKFEAFFISEQYAPRTALCFVVGDRAESEEVTQEAFVCVCGRWDHVGLLDDPKSYLYRSPEGCAA